MSSRRPTAPGGGRRGGVPPARRSPDAHRSASRRPASAARPRTTPAPSPQAPLGLTRRAAVLAMVLLVAALVLAPYLRSLAAQQADIAAMEEEVAEREAAVADLQDELRRWEDPAFVMARARERLFMVLPGETGYVVLDPPSEREITGSDPAAVAAAAAGTGGERPWFGTLWESVLLAGADEPITVAP